MRISTQPIPLILVIAVILPGALTFTGCGTFRNKYGSKEESLAAMEREMAAKSAARALNEMDGELRRAGEGDIFEQGIQAKIPSIGIPQPAGVSLAADEGYIPGMVRTTLNN
jgi:hypothetical protein